MVRYPGESRHPHLALTQLQRLLIKGRTRRAATLITRLRCVYGRTALAPFFSTAEDRSPVVDGTGKIHYPTPPPAPTRREPLIGALIGRLAFPRTLYRYAIAITYPLFHSHGFLQFCATCAQTLGKRRRRISRLPSLMIDVCWPSRVSPHSAEYLFSA
jgi:hypothetical protein